MHDIKSIRYKGDLIKIVEMTIEEDDEAGFNFEIFSYDENNILNDFPYFESYGSCLFDNEEDAEEAAINFIDDFEKVED